MDELRMLKFRWSNKEYGVPVEDVQGIIGKSELSNTTLTQAAIPVLEFPTWPMEISGQRIVLMQSNGVQVGLVIDEIIGVTTQSATEAALLQKAKFEIWRIGCDSHNENG